MPGTKPGIPPSSRSTRQAAQRLSRTQEIHFGNTHLQLNDGVETMSTAESHDTLAHESIRNSPLWQRESILPLLEQLADIRADMLGLESRTESLSRDLAPGRKASARNLLHYVALRRHDIRELQEQLVRRGLSSLGRCESYVMSNVETVLSILSEASHADLDRLSEDRILVDFVAGRDLLQQSTEALLGIKEDDGGRLVCSNARGMTCCSKQWGSHRQTLSQSPAERRRPVGRPSAK
jgi:hypothetical protein